MRFWTEVCRTFLPPCPERDSLAGTGLSIFREPVEKRKGRGEDKSVEETLWEDRRAQPGEVIFKKNSDVVSLLESLEEILR